MVSPKLIRRQEMLLQQISHRHSRTFPLGSILCRIHLTNFHRNQFLHREPPAPPSPPSNPVDSNLAPLSLEGLKGDQAIQEFVEVLRHMGPETVLEIGGPILPWGLAIRKSRLAVLALALLTLPDLEDASQSRLSPGQQGLN